MKRQKLAKHLMEKHGIVTLHMKLLLGINGCVINFYIVPLWIYFDLAEMKTDSVSRSDLCI